MQTRSQKLAQKAIEVVDGWESQFEKSKSEYEDVTQFARRFPTLVQSCGLLQAIAYARNKEQLAYTVGFVKVLRVLDQSIVDPNLEILKQDQSDAAPKEAQKELVKNFEENLSKSEAVPYMRISRYALEAATWIKRYVPPKANGERAS